MINGKKHCFADRPFSPPLSPAGDLAYRAFPIPCMI
jgi:hypothetical protein